MSGHIVYRDVPRTHDDDDQPDSNLFAGQRLWFSHVIPQRRSMIENARLNGAVIVDRDTDADVRLVDHLKKNNAPGTHSYRYVELSLRNGQLENLADHEVGAPSRVSRPVGSTVTAPKLGRTPFTPEDDRFLWEWMKPFIDRGGAWKGNEIYKQMEEANPRHTFQSWRDRWIKHTQFQKRHVSNTIAPEELHVDKSATRPSRPLQKKRRRELHDDGEDQRAAHEGKQDRPTTAQVSEVADKRPHKTDVQHGKASRTGSTSIEAPKHSGVLQNDGKQALSPRKTQPASARPFTKEEYHELYEVAAMYVGGEFNDFDTPWEELADHRGTHTPTEWKHFFISRVIPDYCKNNKLSMSEVAPYLSGKTDEQAVDASEMLDSQEGNQAASVTSETQEEYQCTNCFAIETAKWRHDKEGKLICYECAKFVRQHGHHRPSTAWSIEGSGVNTDKNRQRPNARSSHLEAAQNDPVAQIVLTTDYSLTGRGKQKSLFVAEGSVGSSGPAGRDNSQQPPRITSPSFRPDPPTLSRPPEPNESRKRRFGRGSQSQSTQESNKSGTQSQTLDYSLQREGQSQITPSQALTAEMGETQSKEGDAQIRQPTRAEKQSPKRAASSFLASSKGKQKRPQDGPGDSSVQQHLSISIQKRIRDQPPALSITVSNDDNELSYLAAPSSSSKHLRTYRDYSPLFVPEYDDYDEEHGTTDDEEVDLDAELKPRAAKMFETAQESIQEYETGPEEQPRASNKTIATQALLDPLQDIEDDLDIALELPEPPGGFEAVGVGLSVMPHDGDMGMQAMALRRGQSDQRECSPEVQIKMEDHSFLQSPPVLLNPLDPISGSPGVENMSDPSDNVKGKGREEIEKGQNKEVSSTEPDGHETDDWIALQRSLHPHVPNLEPVLFKAIESTSFDFGLASQVVDIMLANRRNVMNERRRPSRASGAGKSTVLAEADLDMESLLPQAMRGVWTEIDDSLLLSPDANDANKVLRKHGRDGCDTRFVFLEEFVEG